MTDTEKEKASLVAKRLQKTVAQEQSEGEKEGQPSSEITISIGVATFPSDADQADKLVEAAESALCRAKEYSGNLVCVS